MPFHQILAAPWHGRVPARSGFLPSFPGQAQVVLGDLPAALAAG